MTERFSGLWPVMLTAFHEDGSIDWDGVDSLVDFYIDSGVSGLFAVCLSSEMYDLSAVERQQLAGRIVRRSNGRVPVVATGTFGGAVADQVSSACQIAATGVDAVVVLTNQLAHESAGEAGFREALEQFVEATDPMSLGLYECPQPFHLVLSAETVGWAGASGRFKYIKETSRDPAVVAAKVQATADTPLGIFDAYTPNALGALEAGGAGLSPLLRTFIPSCSPGCAPNTAGRHKRRASCSAC